MKSVSFKNRDEMVKKLKSIKSEMDSFFKEMDKKIYGDDESSYLEMKAELHYGI